MKCENEHHKKCCESVMKHEGCCKEWGIFGLIASLWLIPVVRDMSMAIMQSKVGFGVFSTVVFGLASALAMRKAQVWAWENDRPFNDGRDETPDLYLFNPGPGASWMLRAMMPDVIVYSFWKSPISWMVKQAQRKVAVVLEDGSVSFPWFPVAWMSGKGNGGSRIPVPAGYQLPANILVALQKRRDEYKKLPTFKLQQEHRDFLIFTDQIFKDGSKFDLSLAEPVEIVALEGNDCLRESVKTLCEEVATMALLVANKADIEDMKESLGIKAQLIQVMDELEQWKKDRPVALGKMRARLLRLEEQLADGGGCKCSDKTKIPGATKVPEKKKKTSGK